ncbi:MAG: GDSL-type esterase/lipase family protein [Brevinema sp.]
MMRKLKAIKHIQKIREELVGDLKSFLTEQYESRLKIFGQYSKETGSDIIIGDSLTQQFGGFSDLKELNLLNMGISGDNIAGVRARLQKCVYDFAPKKVYLLIGINDMGQAKNNQYIIDGILKIREEILSHVADCDVQVISLLPIHSDVSKKNIVKHFVKPRSNTKIKQINQELHHILGDKFLDLWSLLIDENEELKYEFTSDGLHLSDAAYKIFLDFLKKVHL